MKKDIEWLKEEIEEDIKSWGGGNPDYFRGASDAYENVKDWLNQLDEPEVLSQEFIDERAEYYEYNGYAVVPVDDLQNLLVPKQELPAIPEFVAEWMETVKELDADLLNAIIDGRYNVEVSEWLFIEDDEINTLNGEKLMRAWLDGYTVEEKKYYILLPKIKRNWRYVSLRGNYDEFIDHYTDSVEDLQAFTEKEIKAVEPRYFAFAVPVEELEE